MAVVLFFLGALATVVAVDGLGRAERLAELDRLDASVWWDPVTREAGLWERALPGLSDAPPGASWEAGRQALETRWIESSTANAFLRPLWSELLFRTLGATGPAVTGGPDGWLFASDSVHRSRRRAERVPEHAAWVEAGVLALAARGSECLVFFFPDKASLETRHLPAGVLPLRDTYGPFLPALRARGIAAVDGLALMQRNPDVEWFLRGETHASQETLARVASELAGQVETRDLDLGPPTVSRRERRELRRGPAPAGDLLKVVDLVPGSDAWRSVRDADEAVVWRGAPAPEAAPLTLVGSSFSARGLRALLSGELQAPVAATIRQGVGSLSSLADLLDELDRGRPAPALAIWEIPERQPRLSPRQTVGELAQALARSIGPAGSPGLELRALPQPSLTLSELWWTGVRRGRPNRVVRRWQTALLEAPAFVYPGNGTTGLRLRWRADAATAGEGVWCFASARRQAEEQEEPLRRLPRDAAGTLPIVADGYLTSVHLGSLAPLEEATGFALVSAYRPFEPLHVAESARTTGGIDELRLRRPAPSDEERGAATYRPRPLAIAFELRAEGAAPGATGRILAPDGSLLAAPFPLAGLAADDARSLRAMIPIGIPAGAPDEWRLVCEGLSGAIELRSPRLCVFEVPGR